MTTSEDFQDASTDYGHLTQRQAENIADLAARRAEERMYAKLGRSVVKRFLWALGTIGAAFIAWLNGWLHIGNKL